MRETCLLADFAWMKVVSSGSNRWRMADERPCVVPGHAAFVYARAAKGQVAAGCRAQSSECRDLSDDSNARVYRALPPRREDGAERTCWSAVETICRRHRAQSARAQGRRVALHSAVG